MYTYMAIMLIHITMELMYICYSMLRHFQLSTSRENVACGWLAFPLHMMEKVFSLMVPCIVIHIQLHIKANRYTMCVLAPRQQKSGSATVLIPQHFVRIHTKAC